MPVDASYSAGITIGRGAYRHNVEGPLSYQTVSHLCFGIFFDKIPMPWDSSSHWTFHDAEVRTVPFLPSEAKFTTDGYP